MVLAFDFLEVGIGQARRGKRGRIEAHRKDIPFGRQQSDDLNKVVQPIDIQPVHQGRFADVGSRYDDPGQSPPPGLQRRG